jgi:multiple antibiotic resistance protein
MDTGTSTEYLKSLAALLSIVNPVGAIPVFIKLTDSQSMEERYRTCRHSAVTTGMVLLVSLALGETVLAFFGITIASFRVGGGILIMLIAISMLHAQTSQTKHTEEEARDSMERDTVAVVPLGIPLLAGPGAISTIILNAQRYSSLSHYLILVAEILLVALSVWLSLRSAPFIAALLGRTGINIVTRIMGLIMTAVGVEFIATGMKELFPILASVAILP